jgi:hypothetical protein
LLKRRRFPSGVKGLSAVYSRAEDGICRLANLDGPGTRRLAGDSRLRLLIIGR